MKISLSESGQTALIKHKNVQLIWDLATGYVHPGGSDLFSSKADLKKGIKSIKLMRKFARYMEKTHNLSFIKGVPELKVGFDGPSMVELRKIINKENEPKEQPEYTHEIDKNYRFDFKDAENEDWESASGISEKKFKKAMANDPIVKIHGRAMYNDSQYYDITFRDHKGRERYMRALSGYHLEPITP